MNFITQIWPGLVSAWIVFRAYTAHKYFKANAFGLLQCYGDYFAQLFFLKGNVITERNANGQIIGTVMASIDGATPADKIFPKEMATARSKYRTIGYIGKFAVNPGLQGEVVGLLLLEKVVMKWSRNRKVEALTLIVNPSHKNFYVKIGGEEIGYTAGVEGLEKAPGVLLVIDLKSAISRIERAHRLLQRRMSSREKVEA